MLCITENNMNPIFNMAADEYVLRNFKEDSFMLYRNIPSIIVGRHQNTLAEINMEYVEAEGIAVVRRISGGGAVYHDLGNLNFSFVVNKTGSKEGKINFQKYTKPIIEILQKLSINAKLEGRNDLTIEGKKFSGNAEFSLKNRILHHGTLLFSSEMSKLTKALRVNPLKYKDKSVKSVKSRVTNISKYLQKSMTVSEFSKLIIEHIMDKYEDSNYYKFTGKDLLEISKIMEEKYSTWDWNFGKSPKYNFRKTIKTKRGGTIEIVIYVKNGIMKEVKIFGDYFFVKDTSEIEENLKNILHNEDAIKMQLESFHIQDYFNNVTLDELIKGFF